VSIEALQTFSEINPSSPSRAITFVVVTSGVKRSIASVFLNLVELTYGLEEEGAQFFQRLAIIIRHDSVLLEVLVRSASRHRNECKEKPQLKRRRRQTVDARYRAPKEQGEEGIGGVR
jgi:hypothetical protein